MGALMRHAGGWLAALGAVFFLAGQGAAASFSVGENAVVGSGGCEVRERPEAEAPLAGRLEPKQWVTVEESSGAFTAVQVETEELALEGWVPEGCLMSMEAYFAEPACSRTSWLEKRFRLDGKTPEATARMLKRGARYLLQIFDGSGGMVWVSPDVVSEEPDAQTDQLTFFCGPEGDYWPLFLGDLNGDGLAEIVMAAYNAAEDAPLPLYLYVWNGTDFIDVSRSRCLVEKGRNSGRYAWTEALADLPDHTRWLCAPGGETADGAVEWEVREIAGDAILAGRAAVRLSPDLSTAVVERWISPLRR